MDCRGIDSSLERERGGSVSEDEVSVNKKKKVQVKQGKGQVKSGWQSRLGLVGGSEKSQRGPIR